MKQVDILISKKQALQILYQVTSYNHHLYYSDTAVFNECYSELTPYTVLANSCGFCVYDVYQFQGHAH